MSDDGAGRRRHRVVIVGGGFGGVEAARKLRRPTLRSRSSIGETISCFSL